MEFQTTDKEVMPDVTFNVFVGSETGILKGVCFGDDAVPILKNFKSTVGLDKPLRIADLCWSNWNERKELLVVFSNGVVKWYNTKLKAFEQEIDLEVGESDLVSLRKLDNNFLVGQEDGTVSVWNCEKLETSVKIKTGDNLAKLRQCTADPGFFATGGKENDLKIWNVNSEKPGVPIFKARNVPHDYELRQPVWVQDLTFLPQTTDLVAIASRYGQVRLYDVRAEPKRARDKNRPVINMQFCDHPVMSISATNNTRQVVVGSSKGEVGLVDLRFVGQEKLVRKFHGFSGSVRCITSDEVSPYFVSCSLDRFLYLHDVNQREPVKKLYLKSRLTSVTVTDKFMTHTEKPKAEEQEASNLDVLNASWTNLDMDSILPGFSVDKSPIKRKKVKQ